MKTKVVLAVIMGLVGMLNYCNSQKIDRLTKEKDSYRQNTETLLMGMEQLRKDSAIQAYQIGSLNLTAERLKSYHKEDIQTIKSLKIKLRNVKAISKQNMTVDIPIQVPVIPDSIPNIRRVKLENKHISFVGIIKGDSLDARILVPIQLFQIVHKIPKHKFLWWSWGCKGIKQVISTDNPYVRLNYSEYIEIK